MHASAIVLLPNSLESVIEDLSKKHSKTYEDISRILAPFDEKTLDSDEKYPSFHHDYWMIGGRFDDYFSAKSSVENSYQPEKKKVCPLCKGSGATLESSGPQVCSKCNGLREVRVSASSNQSSVVVSARKLLELVEEDAGYYLPCVLLTPQGEYLKDDQEGALGAVREQYKNDVIKMINENLGCTAVVLDYHW